MSDTIETYLRNRPIEHVLLCTYKEHIEKLLRFGVNGLLFESDLPTFFKAQVEPILAQLLVCLRKTYGEDQSRRLDVPLEELSKNLQALSPLMRSDIRAVLTNDPATDDPIEVIFCYPGFKAVAAHRIAHVLYKAQLPLLPRMIAEQAHEQTGIDIHPGAEIGGGLFIDHGTGVVIGATSIIGRNVTLYQGVTLGAKRFQRDASGVVIRGEPRHPILKDGVTVYAGATILGRITIGAQSVIGGNVWLTESVPERSRITQQRYLTNFFKDGDGI